MFTIGQVTMTEFRQCIRAYFQQSSFIYRDHTYLKIILMIIGIRLPIKHSHL